MKLIFLSALIVLLAWQAKPPTFAQKFAAFDQTLYDWVVAKGTNGDTTTTKAAMMSAANDLSSYNVQQELAKIPIIQQACRWGCTGQFYYYCLNLAVGYEIALCIEEYVTCLRTCGYIPY